MEIFIDSANEKEITKWLDMGVIDGVTTNPSVMLKDGVYDIEAASKKIAKLIHPKPLSVEVTTNDLAGCCFRHGALPPGAPTSPLRYPTSTRTAYPVTA